jgi:hypothetical protein
MSPNTCYPCLRPKQTASRWYEAGRSSARLAFREKMAGEARPSFSGLRSTRSTSPHPLTRNAGTLAPLLLALP